MERAARSISKSMISYLKRAREHKEFLLKETKEFDRSKRHLANMMGLDAKEMTQADIDEAIKYLFPSGLFDKKARPIMKHPDLLYQAKKEAQFDAQGRPYHYLFYTVKPNYYETLSKIGDNLRKLDKFEDEQTAKGVYNPPEDSFYQLSGKVWKSKDALSTQFLEQISDEDYDYFIKSLQQLLDHPYSINAKSFIEQFTRDLEVQSASLNLPEIKKDETTGSLYTEMKVKRREHIVSVKTVLNGSGKFDIDGQNILFFSSPHMRRAIFAPLKITGMQDTVDIFAKLEQIPAYFGEGATAAAIRYAVARSVAAYTDGETRTRLRLAGLLELDIRRKERLKFGQEGARRKYTWKKR